MSYRRPLKRLPYGAADRLPFGKYRDVAIAEVIAEDPQYIVWAWSKGVEFTPEVRAIARAEAEARAAAAKAKAVATPPKRKRRRIGKLWV